MLLDQVPHMLLLENDMALSSSGLSCVAGVLLTRQLVQERFCRRSLMQHPVSQDWRRGGVQEKAPIETSDLYYFSCNFRVPMVFTAFF
uniref:Uncharacterized protein n=1 Tax=Aegilops tauschii subsp. strangulata TaxID=200361 RepID=A0A453JJT0_AEGTS